MKQIPLRQGGFTQVDDSDYEWLSMWKWGLGNGYVLRCATREDGYEPGKNKTISMHRQIMNTPFGMDTDHINGNPLDNRRDNLRICTSSQNSHNCKRQKNNTTGFKGVSFNQECNRWTSSISPHRLKIHLGYFNTPYEAALAYDKAATELFGSFAKINFPVNVNTDYSI